MIESALPTREDMIKEIEANNEFDIVVVGGGITGAGIARDAMLRGLRVCLLDKGDYSSGTSSQSSKLLHGGLRYLQNFEFSLVREAALERARNIEIAPHLSRIYRFVVPLYKWSKTPRIMLRMGLILYDMLAYPKSIGKHKNLGKKGLVKMYPFLKNDQLVGGAYYYDVRTNDSRLTLANIQSATAGTAVSLNYFEVTEWERTDEGILVSSVDHETGKKYEIKGRVLVNASGPWSEQIERMGKNFEGKIRIRRTKGTHITIRPKFDDFAILIANDDNRPIFLIPWDEFTVVGTTDDEWKESNESVKASKADVDYILDALNRLFPEENYSYDDIYSTWAGLRPLVYQAGKDERKTSRNHTINNYGDVITIAGGKLTTYREMAKQTVDKVLKNLGLPISKHRCVTANLPLWGAGYENYEKFKEEMRRKLREEYNMAEDTVNMLIDYYGNAVNLMLKLIDENPSLSEKLEHELPFIRAQVVHAIRYEYARNPVDVLRRRFQIAFCKGNGMASLDTTISLMAKELGWDSKKSAEMKQMYISYVKEFMSVPK